MPRKIQTLPALLLLAPLAGCPLGPLEVNCPDIGWTPVMAEVRDQHGRPAALGATVTIERADGYAGQGRGFGDPLRVHVGRSVSGVFDVTVSKPFHRGETVRGVKVQGDARCGIVREPGRPQLTVTLLEGAPAVRQVVLPPIAYGFGDGNITALIPAHLEADAGVSRELLWASRDTAVARVAQDGTVTSACRDAPGSTFVVASAVADPAVQDSLPVTVYARVPSSGRCP
jgi:hypothetical protein